MRCEYHQDTVQPCALPSPEGSDQSQRTMRISCTARKQIAYALFLYNKTTPTTAKAIT